MTVPWMVVVLPDGHAHAPAMVQTPVLLEVALPLDDVAFVLEVVAVDVRLTAIEVVAMDVRLAALEAPLTFDRLVVPEVTPPSGPWNPAIWPQPTTSGTAAVLHTPPSRIRFPTVREYMAARERGK
jgi:hypothetical protein